MFHARTCPICEATFGAVRPDAIYDREACRQKAARQTRAARSVALTLGAIAELTAADDPDKEPT